MTVALLRIAGNDHMPVDDLGDMGGLVDYGVH